MAVDLTAPDFRANPYPFYAHLRQHEPVTITNRSVMGQAWLLTRYDDVLAALKDPRLSNDRRKVLGSRRSARWMPRILNAFGNSMISTDDPEHRRIRDFVHKAFTPRMIESMAGQIEDISAQLLDQAAAKAEVDLIAEYALPIPLTVISKMMGVPEQDRLKFHHWSSKFLDAVSSPSWGLIVQLPIFIQMLRFFRRLIELRRREPGDDLVSGLVHAEDGGDRLSDDELVAMIFLLLLAGHETTVNLIGNGTLALMEHRDQWQKLVENPDLIESAVEELLRYSNPVEQIAPRFALEDVELHGRLIPKGSIVMVALASANRDETAFDNPDSLDITRHPNRHLAFGMGVHYCLGAPLARLEGKIAIQALAQRFPNMQLAIPVDQVRWRSSITVRGLKALPVRLR